ncbi:MAG: 30S ribosomal protein S6 [Thermomicrobiales bacterium]|nr:30S ribosomal protein S6 [Thermomicrobiales bacterium]
MRDQTRAPRMYELMTILHPDVTEEDLPAALERVATCITGAGGTISETLRDSPWGRRRLAYVIRNSGRDLRDGYYTVWHIDLAPAQVDDMERELKLDEQVIRYLMTHYAPKPLTPQEIEQAEIDAENAAAVAYAAAQADLVRAASARQAGQTEAATEAADDAAAAEEQAEETAETATTIEAEANAAVAAEADAAEAEVAQTDEAPGEEETAAETPETEA